MVVEGERGGGEAKCRGQGLGLVLQGNAYDKFYNSLKTKATRNLYPVALRKLMAFQKVENVNDLLPSLPEKTALVNAKVIDWVVHMKDVEQMAPRSVTTYLAGVLKFYKKNHVILDEDDISDYLPAPRKANATRAYRRQEIALLLQYCGPRERALVLLLTSTGMRIEAAAELRIKHLKYDDQYGLYKLIVYHLDPHEYICFTTPEAAQAINEYLEYRQRCGEKITPESPLIREEFNINDHLIARHPKAMRAEALGDILRYRLQRAGIIEHIPLQESQRRGQKRYPIPRSHGFRRFVITTMINKRINETIRNLLTDHSVKLDKDYYYPTEEEKLAEYLKVVDDLTINDENRLKRQVEILQVKKSDYEVLREQLTIKTDQLDQLAVQVERLNESMGLVNKGREIGKNKQLDDITEDLAANISLIDHENMMDSCCCSCGIAYFDDINQNGSYDHWYVVDAAKKIFECLRCHSQGQQPFAYDNDFVA